MESFKQLTASMRGIVEEAIRRPVSKIYALTKEDELLFEHYFLLLSTIRLDTDDLGELKLGGLAGLIRAVSVGHRRYVANSMGSVQLQRLMFYSAVEVYLDHLLSVIKVLDSNNLVAEDFYMIGAVKPEVAVWEDIILISSMMSLQREVADADLTEIITLFDNALRQKSLLLTLRMAASQSNGAGVGPTPFSQHASVVESVANLINEIGEVARNIHKNDMLQKS